MYVRLLAATIMTIKGISGTILGVSTYYDNAQQNTGVVNFGIDNCPPNDCSEFVFNPQTIKVSGNGVTTGGVGLTYGSSS